MRYIQIKVKFETSFTYEIEDGEYTDEDDMDEMLIEDTIETLADRSNRYWNDADFDVIELDA